jgi:hypothetical protein
MTLQTAPVIPTIMPQIIPTASMVLDPVVASAITPTFHMICLQYSGQPGELPPLETQRQHAKASAGNYSAVPVYWILSAIPFSVAIACLRPRPPQMLP